MFAAKVKVNRRQVSMTPPQAPAPAGGGQAALICISLHKQVCVCLSVCVSVCVSVYRPRTTDSIRTGLFYTAVKSRKSKSRSNWNRDPIFMAIQFKSKIGIKNRNPTQIEIQFKSKIGIKKRRSDLNRNRKSEWKMEWKFQIQFQSNIAIKNRNPI